MLISWPEALKILEAYEETLLGSLKKEAEPTKIYRIQGQLNCLHMIKDLPLIIDQYRKEKLAQEEESQKG